MKKENFLFEATEKEKLNFKKRSCINRAATRINKKRIEDSFKADLVDYEDVENMLKKFVKENNLKISEESFKYFLSNIIDRHLKGEII